VVIVILAAADVFVHIEKRVAALFFVSL